MPTTYGNDIVHCLKSHCGVRGYCRQKWVLQVQVICKFSNERTCKRNRDVQGLSCGFEDKYFFCMSLFLFQFEYMNVAMIHFCLHFHVKVAFVNAHAFYIVAISTSEVDVVFLDHFMCPQINNADSHSV